MNITRNKHALINITSVTIFAAMILTSRNTLAFTKLKDGFETITNTYLMPLTTAIGGAALIVYVLMSYFREENIKKMGQVLVLIAVARSGLEMVNIIGQSFS